MVPTIATPIAETQNRNIDDAPTIVVGVEAVLVEASAMVAMLVVAAVAVAVDVAGAASDLRRALLQGGPGLLHVVLPRPKLL